ncbi:MAG: hypothetical protein Q9M25_02975 [Mariprofundaceae bacterium]|nr:hypothetical protein [Mariprofundaceae bacterium]
MRTLVLFTGLLLVACDASPPQISHVYPDSKSEAFNVYARHCSECHAPSLPSAHVAARWPNVIARMQQHRLQRRMPPIPAADMLILRDYLLAHAAEEKS